MSVSSIGNNPALYSVMTATQSQVVKPAGGEGNESQAQEKAEPQAAQAVEGEAGSLINTYA